jgi:hypothetical protein
MLSVKHHQLRHSSHCTLTNPLIRFSFSPHLGLRFLRFGDGFLPSFSWEFFGVSWTAFSLVNAGRDWFLLPRNRSNDLILFFASFGLARSFFRRHFSTLGSWDLLQA